MQKKKLWIILLALFILLGGAYFMYNNLAPTMAPDQLSSQNPPTSSSDQKESHEPILAPDFTVYTEDGTAVQLSDSFGKPIVLNFWASWCGPCKMEMPDFHDKYLALGDEIHFFMVNVTDGSRETVASASEFIAAQEYTFPVFYDTDLDAAMVYGAHALPTTYFIDSTGAVIAQAKGAISAETLQKGIDMITAENKPGYRQISMEEAISMMESESDYVILDVRTVEEYREKHIPGAINIPNEIIDAEAIEALPNKDQLILVYCRSGNRSKQASEKLAALGYTNIVEFGGINDWPGTTVSE